MRGCRQSRNPQAYYRPIMFMCIEICYQLRKQQLIRCVQRRENLDCCITIPALPTLSPNFAILHREPNRFCAHYHSTLVFTLILRIEER